jgi:hypothetical protein
MIPVVTNTHKNKDHGQDHGEVAGYFSVLKIGVRHQDEKMDSAESYDSEGGINAVTKDNWVHNKFFM